MQDYIRLNSVPEGCQVTSAQDGGQILKMACATNYDIISKIVRLLSALCLSAIISALLSACSQNPRDEMKATLASPSRTLPDQGQSRLLELINQGRAQKNFQKLILDPRLNQAAQDHSTAMQRSNTFDHRVRGERGFQKRLLFRGYPHSHCAENIARAPDPDQVYQLWYNSPGHYKNMLNRQYTYVGISRVGDYWTADFAAPDGL